MWVWVGVGGVARNFENSPKTAPKVYISTYTIVPLASTHGHSQLKCQNLGASGCMEEILEWFNYHHGHASAHLGFEVIAARGYHIVTSPMLHSLVKQS